MFCFFKPAGLKQLQNMTRVFSEYLDNEDPTPITKKSQTVIYLKGFKEKQRQYSIKFKSQMLVDLAGSKPNLYVVLEHPSPSRNPCQYFLNSTSSKD